MIQVLVVDDSALVRQTLTQILERTGEFSVTAASDPFIAEKRIAIRRPDVILLDIEMPGMNGLTFLTQLMASNPSPVVICSARAGEDASVAMEALARGAVDVLPKPRLDVRGFLSDAAALVVDAVRAAALSKRTMPSSPSTRTAPDQVCATVAATWVVAIGASTGGTEALARILPALPKDGPPVLVVQHMPEGFTRAFANRLNDLSSMQVREAVDGDAIRPGQALVAPGNRHLSAARRGSQLVAEVTSAPPVNRHRPSVDVLFKSVAKTFGPRCVGVILTGMGRDGAQGLLDLRSGGAQTIAQDELSSIVFGMPKEAIALGGVTRIVGLDCVAPTILDLLPRA